MGKGLLALAGGTGLQGMQVLIEAYMTALADPKGRQDPHRSVVRHGHERSSATLCGRRLPVTRHPRVEWLYELEGEMVTLVRQHPDVGVWCMRTVPAGAGCLGGWC